ncbi:lipoprotein-releasing ABC transporter permease subunit [Chlamydiota bacterium]
MRKKYELLMALRYLRSKKRHKIIPVITVISITGIAIGVMTLIVVIAVMSGFDRDLKKRILGVYAPITVTSRGILSQHQEIISTIEKNPHVTSCAPFVNGQVMTNVRNKAVGVIMRGIEPHREKTVSSIEEYLKEGTLDFFSNNEQGMLVGTEFLKHHKLKRGDSVEVVSPVAIPTPLGLSSSTISFRIIGVFDSGMYEYDLNLVYVSLLSAQKLFGLGSGVTGITVNINRLKDAALVKKELKKQLGTRYVIKTWIDLNRNLFRALLTEKWVMFWILSLIILVAAFNIASTLIMVVMERTKDIGILKAIGATRSGILKIFLYQGITVGIIGTVIGLISGVVLTKNLNPFANFIAGLTGFEFFPQDIYYLDNIPTQLNVSDTIIIVFCSIIITILASLYPAWQAAKMNPVRAIKYE